MQAYFLVTDGTNEIRIPLPANASVRAVVPWMGAGVETKHESLLVTPTTAAPEPTPPTTPEPPPKPVLKGLPTRNGVARVPRTYDHDFRVKAVTLALSGAGPARVSDAMQIPPSTLDAWIRRHRNGEIGLAR